jgi:ferredoxin, 2Fe-2S
VDVSVMDVVRENFSEELLALCGGCCSCATCHVYIDPSFAALMPPMSDDENNLLDSSAHRKQYSRLSCQIRITEELDGLKLRVAEHE